MVANKQCTVGLLTTSYLNTKEDQGKWRVKMKLYEEYESNYILKHNFIYICVCMCLQYIYTSMLQS